MLLQKGVIDQALKDVIENFQTKIAMKEIYLAHWVRKERQNCYDAMTTSPVESINCHIKHRTKASTLNNTSRSLLMITTGKLLYSISQNVHTNWYVTNGIFQIVPYNLYSVPTLT